MCQTCYSCYYSCFTVHWHFANVLDSFVFTHGHFNVEENIFLNIEWHVFFNVEGTHFKTQRERIIGFRANVFKRKWYVLLNVDGNLFFNCRGERSRGTYFERRGEGIFKPSGKVVLNVEGTFFWRKRESAFKGIGNAFLTHGKRVLNVWGTGKSSIENAFWTYSERGNTFSIHRKRVRDADRSRF